MSMSDKSRADSLPNFIYLGPTSPRWGPRTEADLQIAIDEGLLEESHYLELKRELSSSKGSNQELARDLASLAVHGGTLIVGVAEDGDDVFLAPRPYEGALERIDQVVHSIPDPPLYVLTRVIESGRSREEGYIVVSVPPSAHAPHMVGSRYMGRGDKTKRILTDPEVRELHARQLCREADIHAVLEWQVGRDPLAHVARTGVLASNETDDRHAHLFLVAQPQPGRSGMLRETVSGPGWQQRLLALRETATGPSLLQTTGLKALPPNLTEARDQRRRADGAALTSRGMEEDRTVSEESSGKSIIEWEISEDGQLRMFCSRLSDSLRTDIQYLLDELATLLVRQLIAVVVAASDQGGYLGSWGLGIAGIGMRGLYPSASRNDIMGRGSPYTEGEYRRVTAATYADLTQTPGGVASALVGQLLRAVGTDQRLERAITDHQVSDGDG
jgi:hypothetical protein